MRNNKNAAIFLDRDGTIIEDRGHLQDPSEAVFFPETLPALRKLQNHFLLFIVTNQPGIAEGKISRSDANRVNRHIADALAKGGVEVADIYVCPHRRSNSCRCIKPKPYFLKRAAALYDIDLGNSFTVGDHPHDIQLAENVGAQGIYVLTGHGRKHLPDLPPDTPVVAGIREAVEKITSTCRLETSQQSRSAEQVRFILNLGVACDLWRRADLGPEPKHARQVASVLTKVGIKVHEVSGGWLECEPRPAAIWEALTGRLAPAEWIRQFDCPPEKPGRVLKLLADERVPVQTIG